MSIGSLASLMSLAGSALDSTQKALNVTAQNVANQNTTRRRWHRRPIRSCRH
ncbi:MAG: hypothetical protein JF584_13780 [Acidobacteria bacterium]|nr:hypothetical protein [Acidobacteriota bacterium]